jgi:hypothetical protein
MNIQSQISKFCILLCIGFIGCNSNKTLNKVDEFALFTTIEVFDSINGSIKMIPTIDRIISIPANQSLEKKINILLDSISKNNFKNLKIETLRIDEIQNGYKSLKLNLRENPGFIIPDSLGKYRSWYEFFQGSTGGEHTSIILKESILQRQYGGDWINEVEFYYQNEKMGEWDHIFLSGTIKRN